MHVTDPVELVFLALLLRWEQSAPPDKKQGLLDGERERNTQMSRMAYVLSKVGVGVEDKYFQRLSVGAGWSKPGGKFLDKNKSHMENPIGLNKGWWLDGCASLERKLEILSDLRKLGFSQAFTNSACDFVAGKSVVGYLPTEEEQDEIIRNLRAQDEDA
jgi:hypothetical protein